MSKAHRGKGIRDLPHYGRGTCARCETKNIKALYEVEIDGKKVNVCKKCNAALNNAKKATVATETAKESAE
ncbi:MAG: hypothetical protein BKP49_07415 [Treponema sp. CETP13]|nr:MAG: hypothetical protein BKP49_07415 [Treponema sp. CETP13]